MSKCVFYPEYPLEGLEGAEYNPRRIDSDTLARLQYSLSTIGVGKPIIVAGKTIVAGHQRTRSLRALGCTHAPVVMLDEIDLYTEIRFNQLHNGTDFDSGDENVNVGPAGCAPFTFEEVPADRTTGNQRAAMAALRWELCILLQRYGNWGACVADMSGNVIHAAQYALSARSLGMGIRVYRVPDVLADEARALLGAQYGVFSYDHLKRATYFQTYAQMFRLRPGGKVQNKSAVYEKRIIPAAKKTDRILDLGCGQGDYVKALQRQGYSIFGIEFFRRAGDKIDGRAVHAMIDAAAADIEANGLYDIVLSDFVLNSVDSIQAENDVLNVLNAFCKPGGLMTFSGRRREAIDRNAKSSKRGCGSGTNKIIRREVEFFDEHGFSAIYRQGNWFYQKFHTREQAETLGRRFIGDSAEYRADISSAWSIGGRKTVHVDATAARASIRREFDLMWPGGRSVGKADRMLAAWETARLK